MRTAVVALLPVLVACTSAAPSGSAPTPMQGPAAAREPPAPPAPTTAPDATAEAEQTGPSPPDPAAATAEPEAPPPAEPSVSPDDALVVLFPDGPPLPSAACREGSDADRIRCLLGLAFHGDERARALAIDQYETAGDIAGVERAWLMNGGFRGTIRIVPERPVGRYRRHLEWVARARRDHAEFFAGLAEHATRPIAYRWRALVFKWFRSVRRTTPSAYASDWAVAWNVSGSLHRNADKVRETLFHEIFHLNDQDHDDWSRRALAQMHAAVFARCGTSRACLRPYSPSETTVRGGTYYSFQPDNGESFREYAAELALRYYREQRAVLREERLRARPFKCGPDPNGRAWRRIVDEFFAGVDLVPDC